MRRLKTLEINGFKSFQKKTVLQFESPIVCIVGPNGSGKSNVVEAIRFVLGEQSMKSMRGKQGADLIWKGSKNLPKGSRAAVSIYFNNSDKVFSLPNETGKNTALGYNPVSISREVYPDGINKYILNGAEARLKDIHNLLASVHIGSSGHTIISQGEADRVLLVNAKERKEMIEDALGLKIYQYKIREAQRKLLRAEENIKEVSMLRRENAPHLKFLQKQMEKQEKAKEMRAELLSLYLEYLGKESAHLEEEESKLLSEKRKNFTELETLRHKLSGTERKEESGEENIKELGELERKAAEIRQIKGETERKLGRLEGVLEMEKERTEKSSEAETISPKEAERVFKEISALLFQALQKETVSEIKPILSRMKKILDGSRGEKEEISRPPSQIEAMEKSRREISAEIEKLSAEEEKILRKIKELRELYQKNLQKMRDAEKERFELKMKEQELSSALSLLSAREENLAREREEFENEIREGTPLAGEEIMSYRNFRAEGENRPTGGESREELRRKIERIKIKLEDAGPVSPEIEKEFQEAAERDRFLEKETEDLTKSIKSLAELMAGLKEKIDTEFKEGIQKINIQFQKFFSAMFGGGTAFLKVLSEKRGQNSGLTEEDEEISGKEETEPEQGIEISVSLPHKKVKELHALSGGERSLTSIALLFAMSAVNPPPFLVLDETDAALDEANSRKYGDMLEMLSDRSELIVVTHNRETMSRAGILYGVTIGADGASKLLSVKFDQAAAIAK